MRIRIPYWFIVTALFAAVVIVSLSFSMPFGDRAVKDNRSSSYSEVPDSFDIPQDIKATMTSDNDMLIIPLKSAGRLIMIEAVIDNQSGNLIFDTGATGLVMNRTYFRKYLKTGGSISSGITGSVGEVEQINIGEINISGLSVQGAQAGLADLGHIENRRGIRVLGLIGFDCFRAFEVVIDAVNKELQLHRVDSRGIRINSAMRGINADVYQQFEMVKNILFLNGTVGGKVLKFCLDTGAETNAISSHAPKAALSTISVDRKSSLSGAGQRSVEVLFGTMNDFVFGGHQLKNMETIITNMDALSEAYGVPIDGMLGYDFLHNGVITVNFRKKVLGMKFYKTESK